MGFMDPELVGDEEVPGRQPVLRRNARIQGAQPMGQRSGSKREIEDPAGIAWMKPRDIVLDGPGVYDYRPCRLQQCGEEEVPLGAIFFCEMLGKIPVLKISDVADPRNRQCFFRRKRRGKHNVCPQLLQAGDKAAKRIAVVESLYFVRNIQEKVPEGFAGLSVVSDGGQREGVADLLQKGRSPAEELFFSLARDDKSQPEWCSP